MRRSCRAPRLAVLGLAALLAAGAVASHAEAGWLSRLTREAGDAGAAAGKLGLGALDNAAVFVSKLPATAKSVSLAAHVTQEGHWKFANGRGEVFTAAAPEEMARAVKVLEPWAGSNDRLALYLSEDSVFKHPEALTALPSEAKLHLVAGDEAFRLKSSTGPGAPLVAEVRPNIAIELRDRRMFGEAVFHLARPLNRSNIRLLALEPSGPKTLSSVPSYDPATKTALVDAVDPATLPAALGKLKHQTVVLTGRVEGDLLHFKPSSGGEGKVAISALGRAAEAADVSLIVLQSSLTRQPGGRNWLWQTVSVSGLDDALKRATFGDFLNALGGGRGELLVTARSSTSGRVVISAAPSGSAGVPITDAVGSWFTETASELMGSMIVEGVEAMVPDKEHVEELDMRLVPGIPSWAQFSYLGAWLAGLIGWEFSLAWWRRIWPPEQRAEYRGAIGYHAARLARLMALLLIFLPLAGMPALVCALAMQLWRTLTAPARWWRWLRGKPGGAQAA